MRVNATPVTTRGHYFCKKMKRNNVLNCIAILSCDNSPNLSICILEASLMESTEVLVGVFRALSLHFRHPFRIIAWLVKRGNLPIFHDKKPDDLSLSWDGNW